MSHLHSKNSIRQSSNFKEWIPIYSSLGTFTSLSQKEGSITEIFDIRVKEKVKKTTSLEQENTSRKYSVSVCVAGILIGWFIGGCWGFGVFFSVLLLPPTKLCPKRGKHRVPKK